MELHPQAWYGWLLLLRYPSVFIFNATTDRTVNSYQSSQVENTEERKRLLVFDSSQTRQDVWASEKGTGKKIKPNIHPDDSLSFLKTGSNQNLSENAQEDVFQFLPPEIAMFLGWWAPQASDVDADRKLYRHSPHQGGAELLHTSEGSGCQDDLHPQPHQPALGADTRHWRGVLEWPSHLQCGATANQAIWAGVQASHHDQWEQEAPGESSAFGCVGCIRPHFGTCLCLKMCPGIGRCAAFLEIAVQR